MRLLIACAAATALSLILVLPASAVPIHVHEKVEVKKESADAEVVRGDPLTVLETYTETKTVKRVDHVPPPDADDDGIRDDRDPCIGSCPEPKPEPTYSAPVETAAPAAPTTESYSGTGSYSIPSSIVECESGGDYGAVNPSSGAYGAYQILPSTSASYGCDMSSPAGQDACAAEIYADVGGSAWVC